MPGSSLGLISNSYDFFYIKPNTGIDKPVFHIMY